MNFLAHLWLADRTATSPAGAVLGDVVRGADLAAYPPDIARGIRLHRRVDAATDRHPLIVSVRTTYASGQRRYAGIVLDLACDYVLASDWAGYHSEPLTRFCQRVSAEVAAGNPWFEYAGGRTIEASAFAQLLLSYADAPGIERALSRTARRLREPEKLLAASMDWKNSAEMLREKLPQLLEDLRLISSDEVVSTHTH